MVSTFISCDCGPLPPPPPPHWSPTADTGLGPSVQSCHGADKQRGRVTWQPLRSSQNSSPSVY